VTRRLRAAELARNIILPALSHALSHASKTVNRRRATLVEDVERAFVGLAIDADWESRATRPASKPPSERPPVDVTGLYALVCCVGALAQGLVS
jgi:hypothetical protein